MLGGFCFGREEVGESGADSGQERMVNHSEEFAWCFVGTSKTGGLNDETFHTPPRRVFGYDVSVR